MKANEEKIYPKSLSIMLFYLIYILTVQFVFHIEYDEIFLVHIDLILVNVDKQLNPKNEIVHFILIILQKIFIKTNLFQI